VNENLRYIEMHAVNWALTSLLLVAIFDLERIVEARYVRRRLRTRPPGAVTPSSPAGDSVDDDDDPGRTVQARRYVTRRRLRPAIKRLFTTSSPSGDAVTPPRAGDGIDGDDDNGFDYVDEDKDIQECGNVAYDSEYGLCCDGVLSPKHSASTACCGQAVYDTETVLCFDGTLLPKAPSTVGICGAVSYDTAGNICCRGKVYRGSLMRCCGAAAYNPVYDACCDDRIISRKTEMCCDGTVQAKPDEAWTCCGTQAVNRMLQTCDDGTVQTIAQ